MKTVADALQHARQRLQPVSQAPAQEARWLVGAVLARDSAWLYAHPAAPLNTAQITRLQAALQRRAAGYPLAYLLGEWGFYEWDFTVDENVLIPRPETELLVEQAATWARTCPAQPPAVLDVGTGSGVIAISLALLLPRAPVTAVDISPAALQTARANAARLGADHIDFRPSDLLEDLPSTARFDLIAANLPYIASDALNQLDVARHEPRLALDGGPQGTTLIERFLQQAPAHLRPGGAIFMEIGDDQGQRVADLARTAFPAARVRVLPDLNARDRVVAIETVPSQTEG